MQYSTGSSAASAAVDLCGRWQLAGWFANVSGQWKHHGGDRCAQSVWNIVHGGSIVVEDPESGERVTTSYSYDADKFFLRMNWPSVGSGGAVSFNIDKIFRVIPLSDDVVALYDLEGVFREPDDYLFMLVMKRLPGNRPD